MDKSSIKSKIPWAFIYFMVFLVVGLSVALGTAVSCIHKLENTEDFPDKTSVVTGIKEFDPIRIYDSRDFDSVIGDRRGTICIERVFGVVEDSETGDGKMLNSSSDIYNYISYNCVRGIQKGDIVMSYFIYSPDNNETDDVLDRFDYIISREAFEEGEYGTF